MVPVIPIVRLAHAPQELPAYATLGAAGMDLSLAGPVATILPGERVLLPTGFCIAIPHGFEGQVRLRSGFARRTGCIMPNAPGTIDADYRGELLVMVMNASGKAVEISNRERFAQLVISPVVQAIWQEVEVLPPTERGAGGFGSTG
ncbi:MAG: dUTP diphosphatase [bacterium]|nr:dUTP diphosphatase [bacterium]